MKKVKSITKRLLALILSAMLITGSLPGKVYAAEDGALTGEEALITVGDDAEVSGEEASVSEASAEAASQEVIPGDQNGEDEEKSEAVSGKEDAEDSEEKSSAEEKSSEDEQNPEEASESGEAQASLEESADEEDSAAEASSEEEEKIIEEQEDNALLGDWLIGSDIDDLWDAGRRQTHRKTGNTNKTITGLGTGAITDPIYPETKDTPWQGSYVWYGFEWVDEDNIQEEVRYRVLDAKTDRFGDDTMLLDCDTVLGRINDTHKFLKDTENPCYATFPLRVALNDFNNNFEFDFLQQDESFALAQSTIDTHKISDKLPNLEIDGTKAFTDYTPLDGDYVFILDYEDIVNMEYGYFTHIGANQEKINQLDHWQDFDLHAYHLRSFANSDYLQADGRYTAANGQFFKYREVGPAVYLQGAFQNESNTAGISPAFNVDRGNIVFSSLVSGTAGQVGAEYKLTLVTQDGFSLSASDVIKDGNSYKVPFWINIGEDQDGNDIGPTQVSVVVTDGTWSYDEGWSDNANLLQYTSINNDSFTKTGSGEGTFTLDSSITGEWGKDYHVYILAECINGEKESDLASEPYEIFPHAHSIKITAKDNELIATCTEAGCYLPDNKLSVRIISPEAQTYGSEESYAAFLDGEDVQKFLAIVSAHFKDDFTIYYTGRGDTTYAKSNIPPTGVGLYTASLTIGGETAFVNYEIQKKYLRVKADDKSISYGDYPPTNYTASYDGFVNGDNKSSLGGTLTFDCDYERGNDAGEYNIILKGLTSDNYEIQYMSGKLTVQKVDATIQLPIGYTNVAFTGRAQELAAPGSSDHGQLWYALTDAGSSAPQFDNGRYGIWSTDVPTAVNAGSYRIWYMLIGDKNHNDSKAEYITASIVKKSLPEDDYVKIIKRNYPIGVFSPEKIYLSEYLPADCGDVNYGKCQYSNQSVYEKGTTPNVLNSGLLSYVVSHYGVESRTDTITVTATAQNYEDAFTISIIVTTVPVALCEKKGNSYSPETEEKLLIGKSITLFLTDNNGVPVSGEKVIWKSDNPSIASVSQNGKITGVSAGKTIVTAQLESLDSLEAQCEIIVSEPVTEISLDKKKYSFGTGEEVELTVSILPLTATQSIKWSTSDRNAVIICNKWGDELNILKDDDRKGRVYDAKIMSTVIVRAVGPSKGKVTVTAETIDGSGKKASCSFEVGNPVGEFKITAKSGKNVVTTLQAGKTVNMAVEWTGGVPKNKDLTWKVVDLEGYPIYGKATISEKGVLKGISEGTIRVAAFSNANPDIYSLSDPIVIYVPIKSVALREKTATVSLKEYSEDAKIVVDLVAVDGSKGMSMPSTTGGSFIVGSNATGESLKESPYVTYEVQDKYKSLIEVTGEGRVSANKSIPAGTKLPATAYVNVTVHAYDYIKTLSYKVTVKDNNPLKGIKLQKNLTIGVNNLVTLKASLDPLNPDNDFTPGLIWSIDEKDKDIIRISQGFMGYEVVGLKPGTATITVKTRASFKVGKKEVPFSATCKVTVKPSVSAVSFKNAETLTKNGLAVGKSFKLQPEFTLTGKGSAASKALVWESSDTTIAQVSDKGVITAVGAGSGVTITATMAGDNNSFTNTKPEVSVTFDVFNQIKTIKIDKTKMTIGTQDNSRFGRISIAAVTPENATSPAVKWSVDKNNTGVLLGVISGDKTARNASYAANPGESVTTRDEEYLAVMGITPGVVKITGVTTDGSNKKVSCTVTVRGQVTRLKLKEKISNSEYNSIRLTNSPSDKVLKYESFMKTNTSISMTTDIEINGISSSNKLFSSYKKYTDTGLIFRSSNTKVATVNSKGKIKIQKNPNDSSVTIYASTIDGRQNAELHIDVDDMSGK